MKSRNKHENLTRKTAAILRRMIELGEVGEPLPPERQFATLLDVSRVTIRRAMLLLEEESVVRRVQGQGTFAEQGPQMLTPAELSREATPVFLVLAKQSGPRLNIQRTPFTWRICSVLQDVLERQGTPLRFMSSDRFIAAANVGQLATSKISGFFAPGHMWSGDEYDAAMSVGVPWVALSRTSLAMTWNIIDLDWADALCQAIDDLSPGPKDKVFIPNPPYPAEVDQQRWLETALTHLHRFGVMADQIVIRADGTFESNGYLATRWYLREHGLPTIVLSNFDLSAAGAYRAIRAHHDGKQDPVAAKRVRFVGGANLAISHFLSPALSTLGVDFRHTAALIMEMLAMQRKTKRPAMLRMIRASYVRRESSAGA